MLWTLSAVSSYRCVPRSARSAPVSSDSCGTSIAKLYEGGQSALPHSGNKCRVVDEIQFFNRSNLRSQAAPREMLSPREIAGNHVMQAISPQNRRFCPRCGRNQIARSHFRGVIEQRLLRTLHLHAYRCCDCGKRFYSRSPRPRAA